VIDYLEPADMEAWIERVGLHFRDRALYLSALAGPMPVFGEEVHPGIHRKAAVLMDGVNRNDPLLDGNKRLSWATALAFYAVNGYDLRPTDDTEGFIRRVAAGGMPLQDIAEWLRAHAHPLGDADVDASTDGT
jgi:death on curing protein